MLDIESHRNGIDWRWYPAGGYRYIDATWCHLYPPLIVSHWDELIQAGNDSWKPHRITAWMQSLQWYVLIAEYLYHPINDYAVSPFSSCPCTGTHQAYNIYIYINIRYYIKYVQFTYFFLFNLAYAAYSSLSDIQCRCFEEPIPRGRLGPGRIFTRNFQGSFDGRDSVL